VTNTIKARVARGAALLDEKLPGWHERVGLEKLDLSRPCYCILGQEFREMAEGTGESGWDVGLIDLFGDDADEAGRYGFTVQHDSQSFAALTAEWKRVILARRNAS
jgi:hypothetical protein